MAQPNAINLLLSQSIDNRKQQLNIENFNEQLLQWNQASILQNALKFYLLACEFQSLVVSSDF